ncbi:MAG: 50S ribosomal protein L3, partial [Candidatus Hydrogenedentes bacterium]|nr:50S ribosomal protein L3 [Candidatus Hydrogenedentota bacterium]
IPEGFFEIEYRGRKDRMMFPRKAGSWYHQSKVHDTNNVEMACRIWNLRSTDIMQGVVYSTQIDNMPEEKNLKTRFDFDQSFGTVINRFCAQATVGIPLTPYGTGKQKRGFLPLRDSMQCLTIAVENSPEKGEYRVFNQFEEVYDITELALKVQKVGNSLNLNVEVKNLEEYSDVRVNVYTQPHLAGINKKRPEIFEVAIGGKNLQEKFNFAKSMLGKEIPVKDVFKEGQQLDIFAVTKAKGTQGPIKRFGVLPAVSGSEETVLAAIVPVSMRSFSNVHKDISGVLARSSRPGVLALALDDVVARLRERNDRGSLQDQARIVVMERFQSDARNVQAKFP